MSNSIILMGIKHCGKSTQARLLSSYYDIPSFDTDDLVTKTTGKTPREIYSANGADAFMRAELNACQELQKKLESMPKNKKYNAVIATGGGICANRGAVELLRKTGIIVFLNADEQTAANRILREIKIAPDGMLSNMPAYIAKENPHSLKEVRDIFHNFYVERQKLYNSICNICVDMKPVSKAENRDSIIEALAKSFH